MANTKRRLPDREGKIFIPYNIGGGTGDEHFIGGGKLAILSALLVGNILFLLNLYDGNTVWYLKLGITLATLFIDMYIIRICVLNEIYFYKLYKRLDDYRVCSPAVFWDIVSIQDTGEGAQLIYSDLKTAMMVRLERDTITGKPQEFKETHFDAISDFYRLLNMNGYSFVQMNVMEQAGNDPRLQKLDELVTKADNKNIAELMEMQVAYIKNITRATLYESEYFLIYTRDSNKARYMGSEINDILYKILDGGFVGFRIMEAQEIMQFVKEMYGVKLFDPAEAMLGVFRKSSGAMKQSFEIRSVHYNDGRVQVFELQEEKIQKMKDAKKAGKKKKESLKEEKKAKKDAGKVDRNKQNKEDKKNGGIEENHSMNTNDNRNATNKASKTEKNIKDKSVAKDKNKDKNKDKKKDKLEKVKSKPKNNRWGKRSPTDTMVKNENNVQNNTETVTEISFDDDTDIEL